MKSAALTSFLLFFFLPLGASEGGNLGEILPLYSILPFAGILLSISLFPLLFPHFWHKRYPSVSLFWGLAFSLPFIAVYKNAAFLSIIHIILVDYLPFLILLWGLFTVSGGIVFRGSMAGTPSFNTALLSIGTILASFMGTTGAAMLMIRPLLRANKSRKHKKHIIVFFIFLVANVGGVLTPLGDPPLFLGFLHGVPFFWTLKLILPFLFACVFLLTVFFAMDFYFFRKENIYEVVKNQAGKKKESFKIKGAVNFLLLLMIVAAVLFSGTVKLGGFSFAGMNLEYQDLVRDAAIIAAGLVSMRLTGKKLRQENGFSWEPMKEVAILFAAIFVTMIPALAILKAGGKGSLAFLVGGLQQPWHYFWLSGALSSFLDNAPTYLTFLNMSLGRFSPGLPEQEAVKELISNNQIYLKAISLGAVFMGANTYIGNAPNFMVRSIAEESGIAMPSFLGYLFKWSIPILIPLFILIGFIFL
jgi:Na+/H+ antiporter NhaD/arsenite permease-like protein